MCAWFVFCCSALQLKEVKNGRPTPTLPPVVLVTQIMSLLKDKREVEAELDTLRRKNTIRMFKLATGTYTDISAHEST